MAVDISELDRMQAAFKAAVDEWVVAIREEEDLASPAEHSEAEVDSWEAACFKEEDARKKARQAKKDYEDALREKFFNF